MVDPLGEDRDLDLGAAGVGLVEALLLDDAGLGLVDLLRHVCRGLRSAVGTGARLPRALAQGMCTARWRGGGQSSSADAQRPLRTLYGDRKSTRLDSIP